MGRKAAMEQRNDGTNPIFICASRKVARITRLNRHNGRITIQALHNPSECSPFTCGGGARASQPPTSAVPVPCFLPRFVGRPPSKGAMRLSAIENYESIRDQK